MSSASTDRRALDADWLELSRRALVGVRSMLDRYPSTPERAQTTGRGEGGDMALVIDRGAEDAVFAELERLGLPLTAVSEERGHVPIAGGGPVHVVIDPIDGSVNAKRGVPLYALSIAVAGGPTMGDVRFGYVYDLGRAEEWWAARGRGAYAGGRRLQPPSQAETMELLAVESAEPRYLREAADLLVASGAGRVRAIGSIALSLCWVAAGRFDASISLRNGRSVDAAAGQLVVREAGRAVAFPDADQDPARASLDLTMRSRVLSGHTQALDRLVGLLPPLV